MTYVSHLLLVVSDVAESAKFLAKFSRLEAVLEHSRPSAAQRVVWLRGREDGAAVILVEGPGIEVPLGPYAHVGVACSTEEEFDELLTLAVADDVVERGPEVAPWPIAKWFSVLTPDGHRIEISIGQDLACRPD